MPPKFVSQKLKQGGEVTNQMALKVQKLLATLLSHLKTDAPFALVIDVSGTLMEEASEKLQDDSGSHVFFFRKVSPAKRRHSTNKGES